MIQNQPYSTTAQLQEVQFISNLRMYRHEFGRRRREEDEAQSSNTIILISALFMGLKHKLTFIISQIALVCSNYSSCSTCSYRRNVNTCSTPFYNLSSCHAISSPLNTHSLLLHGKCPILMVQHMFELYPTAFATYADTPGFTSINAVLQL